MTTLNVIYQDPGCGPDQPDFSALESAKAPHRNPMGKRQLTPNLGWASLDTKIAIGNFLSLNPFLRNAICPNIFNQEKTHEKQQRKNRDESITSHVRPYASTALLVLPILRHRLNAKSLRPPSSTTINRRRPHHTCLLRGPLNAHTGSLSRYPALKRRSSATLSASAPSKAHRRHRPRGHRARPVLAHTVQGPRAHDGR